MVDSGDEAMMKARWLLPLMLAATSLAAPVAAQEAPGRMAPITGTRLDIAAEGSVTRAPDVALISAGVVTQAATAAAAMSDNASRMAATVGALKRAGVADKDIQTSSISLSPQYRYAENRPPVITGYQAANQVNIRFREIKRAGGILDALVAVGANQINGPNLMVDEPEDALDEARTVAIAKARARAELYAKAAGLRVKRILSISESGGYAPPPPPMPMMQARMEKSAADTSIEPGEQRLSVAVSVSFELE
jgi:uncharacterized protein YggE